MAMEHIRKIPEDDRSMSEETQLQFALALRKQLQKETKWFEQIRDDMQRLQDTVVEQLASIGNQSSSY